MAFSYEWDRNCGRLRMVTKILTFIPWRDRLYVPFPWMYVGLVAVLTNRTQRQWHCASFWAQVFTDWQLLFPIIWNIHFWRTSLYGNPNPHGETMLGHLTSYPTDSIYCLPNGWIILNSAQSSFQMIPGSVTISCHTQLVWMTQAIATWLRPVNKWIHGTE